VTSFERKASIESADSFLKETDRNSAIDDEIRQDIEKKYRHSHTNKTYVFPRKNVRPKKGLSVPGKPHYILPARMLRERRQVPRSHVRATSELANYSPYMTRTPDLR
jgi:hypothetical protein